MKSFKNYLGIILFLFFNIFNFGIYTYTKNINFFLLTTTIGNILSITTLFNFLKLE